MSATPDPAASGIELCELLRTRRTIHDFESRLPPRESVMTALEVARWAPNHRLTQPWSFHLLGPHTAERICLLNAELVRTKSGDEAAEAKLRRWRSMPGWLAVTCRKDSDATREREDYAACCCAVQNLMLALWAQGIGSKWSTGKVIRDPAFLDLIGADNATVSCVGLIWFGYPATVPTQAREPLAGFIHECD